jgi:hypothetical protein
MLRLAAGERQVSLGRPLPSRSGKPFTSLMVGRYVIVSLSKPFISALRKLTNLPGLPSLPDPDLEILRSIKETVYVDRVANLCTFYITHLHVSKLFALWRLFLSSRQLHRKYELDFMSLPRARLWCRPFFIEHAHYCTKICAFTDHFGSPHSITIMERKITRYQDVLNGVPSFTRNGFADGR